MTQKCYAEKTQIRMSELTQLLESYAESIARLQAVAEGRLTLKSKREPFGKEQDTPTTIDDKRLAWTLHNIKTQQRMYQHELEVLQEYGD